MSRPSCSQPTIRVPRDEIIPQFDLDSQRNNNHPPVIPESHTETMPDSPENLTDNVPVQKIGVPMPGFNIHSSVLYSHGYYEKVRPKDDPKGAWRAMCMQCSMDKKETILRIKDGNIRGMFT